MASINEFQALLQQAMRGDSVAMTTLIERYEPQIRVVVRARLGAPLKRHLDSVDVLQSVHRSLIVGLQRGQFKIESVDKLVALAATIAQRKIAQHWRHAQSEAAHVASCERLGQPHEPNPGELLAAKEQTDEILDRLGPLDRQVLELRLRGHNTAEAARILGLEANVVRVRLSRLRARLKRNLPISQPTHRS